jgi:hypothetical protein
MGAMKCRPSQLALAASATTNASIHHLMKRLRPESAATMSSKWPRPRRSVVHCYRFAIGAGHIH